MATVRFSEELKSEILANAKNVFAARYEVAVIRLFCSGITSTTNIFSVARH